MFREVAQVAEWAFGGFDGIESVLDFASGHGRFTRFLLQTVPSDKVWDSDIYADAMDFQRREFGVRCIPSCDRPEDYRPGRHFDLIFVASLFSHPQHGVTIEITADGKVVGTATPQVERPDVAAKYGPSALLSAWNCRLEERWVSPDRWIAVRATTSWGDSAILALDTAREMSRYLL